MTFQFFRSVHERVAEYEDWGRSDNPRIPTGFKAIDGRINGGVALGEVLLFQCRSGVGKTTFGVNVVEKNSGVPSIFYSLEMQGRYIAQRLAAVHSNVPTEQIETEVQAGNGCAALARVVQDFPHLGIASKSRMSIKEMRACVAEAKQAWNTAPRLCVIDFLELIGGVPALASVDKIDQISRDVKDFAKDEDMAVILLTQVGRGSGGAGDQPLDITSSRYGGETSADYVVGAFRPSFRPGISQTEYERVVPQIWFQLLKSRAGSKLNPSGTEHYMHPATLRISDWGEQPTQPLFATAPVPASLAAADRADMEETEWAET